MNEYLFKSIYGGSHQLKALQPSRMATVLREAQIRYIINNLYRNCELKGVSVCFLFEQNFGKMLKGKWWHFKIPTLAQRNSCSSTCHTANYNSAPTRKWPVVPAPACKNDCNNAEAKSGSWASRSPSIAFYLEDKATAIKSIFFFFFVDKATGIKVLAWYFFGCLSIFIW